MSFSVGIRSLAVKFPSVIRTNDYYRQHHPELIEGAAQKTLAKAFEVGSSHPKKPNLWQQEAAPYLSDPFRGVIERRVLGPDESSLTLEYHVALDALKAAHLSPEQVDLMLVASIFPHDFPLGDAAFLAKKLGLQGAAWNLDSTCSSAVVALQNACALVRAGEYQNVLVVVCTTYSRFTDKNDTLSFLAGDAAGAFVVGTVESNQGIIGTKVVNTAETCGTFFNEFVDIEQGKPKAFIRASEHTSKVLKDITPKVVLATVKGAISAAGVSLEDIDFFEFHGATAWNTNVCARIVGVSPTRTINLNPLHGNIGPVLPLVNLYYAARTGKIRANDLVLVSAIGSSSNAAASVMRWGDVALGQLPANSDKLLDVARGKADVARGKADVAMAV